MLNRRQIQDEEDNAQHELTMARIARQTAQENAKAARQDAQENAKLLIFASEKNSRLELNAKADNENARQEEQLFEENEVN